MEVRRAQVLGFCMGVRRAVDMALAAAERGGTVYTLGPLIHNPQVQASLAARGITPLDETRLPERLDGATVIIRAHGIPPGTEAEIRRRGAAVVDATCPRVKASQMKARDYAEAGYRVFIAGEKRHGEVAGIRGYAASPAAPPCVVVGSPGEVEATVALVDLREKKEQEERQRREKKARPLAPASPPPLPPGDDKVVLIGQTTITPEEYADIAGALKKSFPRLEVVDSICGASRERQDSLRELCAQTGAVVIAGSAESSNTRRLLDITRKQGKKAALIETPEELSASLLASLASWSPVGLTAGASTPDEVIDAIERKLAAPLPPFLGKSPPRASGPRA